MAATTLHQHLSRLRRCLGAENLPEAGAGGYRLAAGVKADWTQFCELTRSSRHAEPAEAHKNLTQALELVRGAPFAGVDERYSWAWNELLVSQMTGSIAAAAHQLASLALRDGDPSRAWWAAEQGLLAVPTDESLHEDRMAAAAAASDRPAFDRAWSDANRILGLQAQQGRVGRTGRSLDDELRRRLQDG